MPNHADMTGSEIHNPKGFDTASNNTRPKKDGSGNLVWASDSEISSGTARYGEMITADGNGDTAFKNKVWKDLTGSPSLRSGGTAPTARVYRTGVYQFAYSAGNQSFIEFHIPHDWAVGTDLFLHIHWSHITAATTSTAPTFDWSITYAKGHNQAAFIAPITITQTGTNTVPQYRHIVDEIQLSASAPTASQLDADDIEVDGVILANFTMTALPTGVGINDMFIHFFDIHYQADIEGTLNKAPNFYA
jgi:hypothetical protein